MYVEALSLSQVFSVGYMRDGYLWSDYKLESGHSG
jgi:hypothetical protein